MEPRLHTSYPRVDPRFPHLAPVLGAQPLVHEPERRIEEAVTDAPPAAPSSAIRQDPWPEVSVGVGTAALSGALVGGIAAGGWPGAAIGASVNAGMWSGFTILNTWRELGPKAKGVLGATLLLSVAGGAAGLWWRSR